MEESFAQFPFALKATAAQAERRLKRLSPMGESSAQFPFALKAMAVQAGALS